MDRRTFFSVVRRGRLRVLELSCERLHMRWIDARARAHAATADEDPPLESGEPPTRVAAETAADLFEELDRQLAQTDVVRVVDREWLNEDELRRRVDAAIGAFERRGGRVENSRAGSSLTRALAVALGLCIVGGAQAHAQTPRDAVLQSRVEAALRASSDIPVDSIMVGVQEGVVTLTGSVICDDDACGGNATPGGAGTVQQSLGAVVRAVPGVTDVRFVLRYRPLDPGG
jgi:hypothetical protein